MAIARAEPVSNEVLHLLQTVELPMVTELWAESALEYEISTSERALALLDLGGTAKPKEPVLKVVMKPGLAISIDVAFDPPLPGTLVVGEMGDKLVKGTTPSAQLLVVASNATRCPVDIVRLRLVTREFRPDLGRLLTSVSPLGLYEPPTLRATPQPVPGAESSLLDGKVWRIEPGGQEAAKVEFQEAPQGWYSLSIVADVVQPEASARLVGPAFLVAYLPPEASGLRVFSFGRHYPWAAAEIHRTMPELWSTESEDRDVDGARREFVLGPTLNEQSDGIAASLRGDDPPRPKTLLLRRMTVDERDDGILFQERSAETLAEFTPPGGEPIHDWAEVRC